MSRTSKLLMGVVAVSLCGVVSPAFAAPAPAATPAGDAGPGAMEKLSAAEVKVLEQRNPGKAARIKADSARRQGGSAVQGRYVRIKNASGKCLAIGNSSTANGAHAIQWDCTTSNAQIWWVDGSYIQNYASEKFLAIGESSTANGAHAIQWDCTTSNAQIWWVDGSYIQNYASEKFLAIGESSTANGAHAIQWEYTGSQGQRWTWPGEFIWNDNSGKVLAIGESSTANGAHALQWTYTGSNGQRWYRD